MLNGKNVLLGITGGIACYKSCEIVSRLKKLGASVDVVMTKNATEFVQPLTFETLSQRPVTIDMFAKKEHFEVEHISLAKKANICIIAPATANVIAKLAEGIADDMLTTTVLALNCPIIIAPAMNTNMYNNPITQANMKRLKDRGYIFVEPQEGRLACGDTGKGKMAEPIDIVSQAIECLLPKQDYKDKTILITAGATREPIDKVRFLTNKSSGKMGMELAKAVIERGGKVILVKGITTVDVPSYITDVINVETTQEMYDAVMNNLDKVCAVIKAAAPADYKIEKQFDNKIKDEKLTLSLVKNPDIAKAVGEKKGDKKLVIFCAETQDLLENANKKLVSKNADMIVANDVTIKGAGFDVDTNIVSILKRDSQIKDYPIMSKKEVANIILDEINKL